MSASESSAVLHVANGDSTTSLIARAGIPGALSIWADVLHEGPVPSGLSDEELLVVRALHLADPGAEPERVLAEFRRWDEPLERLTEYEELVLWFEHDLFDQLNLIQVLDRLARKPRGTTRVTLVSIDSFPGRITFKGMGELTPEELAPLFDTREPVSDEQYAVARAAWSAFRSPDPRRLEQLLELDLSALPFLAAALRRHLQEFPSTLNGLSRSEQHLLDLVASGQTDIHAVFPQMHVEETCFYIADLSFWNLATALAADPHPLLQIAATPSSYALPSGEFALTAAGSDVRRAAADRVRLCGIDRWLGGVHLHGTGPVWRWDAGSGSVVSH
jgi:hypothetical protein